MTVVGTGEMVGLWDGDDVSRTTTAAFPSFFSAEWPRLVGILAAMSGLDAAQDIAQDAFMRAERNWAVVSGYDRPDLWLRRVALRLASSRRRQLMAELRAMARLGSRPAPRPTETEPTPEVWQAVRALPRRQGQVVALYYVAEMSTDEVARVLGISAGSVRAHLHRARASLALRLGELVEEGDR